MAVHADRTRGRRRGAPRPGERGPGHGRRRVAQSAGLVTVAAGVATVTLLTAFATPAAAQQTVIIGGPAIIGSGAGGIVVNSEVLENLGASPEVSALPYQAPGQAPGRGFGGAPVTPGFVPGTVPGIAYRQPDTGQLLVTRPGRLLFPPPRAPRSRLATATPEAPMARPAPKLTSRLLVPPPPMPPAPVEPVAVEKTPVAPVVEKPVAIAEPPAPPPPPASVEPKAAAPAPPPLPPSAPPPAPKAPEPQVAAQPMPSEAAEAPPPPSTLTDELTRKPAPAEPGREPVAMAKAEPAPVVQPAEPAPPPEPVVEPTAPPPEPPPALAAPAAAVAEPEPPPPPAVSLTSGPAVEPQTAALPPAPALAEQIRVLFQDGSVELDDDAKRKLSAVATALMENTTMRIQLLAYAGASLDGTSRARRLSLSRALAVRAYLIEKGVRSTRMDVRALGDKIGDGPADRVDIRPQAVN